MFYSHCENIKSVLFSQCERNTCDVTLCSAFGKKVKENVINRKYNVFDVENGINSTRETGFFFSFFIISVVQI